MGLFWNNGKKVKSDAKNLLSDTRYAKNGNRLSGTDQQSNLIADIFNTLAKKK